MIIESLKAKDFISIADLSQDEFKGLLMSALTLKQDLKAGNMPPLLAGKSLAMIFEKPSLRTRSTFDVGMFQLGGRALMLDQTGIGLGVRESVKDVAKNLERWVDGIMARTYLHQSVLDLAKHANVPVINGLTDMLHPCQIMADYLALIEHFATNLEGFKLVFVGDGNNVAASHINAAIHSGVELVIACPPDYMPDANLLVTARAQGAKIAISHDPREAIIGANALYTDVWISMGQEEETARRKAAFAGYTITPAWFKDLAADGVFMHDLPAHYGEECTEECVYNERSIVFEQAENRLHAQKAVLYQLMRT